MTSISIFNLREKETYRKFYDPVKKNLISFSLSEIKNYDYMINKEVFKRPPFFAYQNNKKKDESPSANPYTNKKRLSLHLRFLTMFCKKKKKQTNKIDEKNLKKKYERVFFQRNVKEKNIKI